MIDPANWIPADGLILEPNALTAAREQTRCQALTAGPGAGKTEMLAQRADFLLRTGSCRYPKRILAISFKVDASQNLKDRVRRRCGPHLASRFDSHTFHAFAKRIIERFRPELNDNNALDSDFTIGDTRVARRQIRFSDLIPLAVEILENSAIARNAIRQTYSDVFLDEFQDCTDQQYKFIKLAFYGTTIRMTAVGDTKQRIMGWAGALEGIFVSFATDFQAVALNLYRNFRSQPQLLRMQNEIIKILDPPSAMSVEQIQGDHGTINIQSFDNSQQEATSLADQVECWIREESLPHSEIAILVSKQAEQYAEFLMAEFKQREIPFRNEQQLQDLIVEPATRLIIDYFLVLFGSREPCAYSRLMEQLTDIIIDDHASSKMRRDWLHFLKNEREKAALTELFDWSFDSRWAYVISFLNQLGKERLISLSAEYESSTRLNDVLKNTKKCIKELLDAQPDIIKALSRLIEDQAIRIMTIHKSKGLEFDSVIILGVEQQSFWSNIEEERCAFFVGVSRAKKRLILTAANTRPRPNSFTGRWEQSRTPHQEFLGYATQFCKSP